MLNDPWGQVYLEAMASRTPVMGLNRNGLPELVDGGRHGFLVDRADPAALAEAILSAVSDPQRLERMATTAQRHVLENYSWNRVAETDRLLLKPPFILATRNREVGLMSSKVALITGITGQDGAYLADFLLSPRLHRARRQAPLLAAQHRAHRLPVPRPPRRRCQAVSCTTAT